MAKPKTVHEFTAYRDGWEAGKSGQRAHVRCNGLPTDLKAFFNEGHIYGSDFAAGLKDPPPAWIRKWV